MKKALFYTIVFLVGILIFINVCVLSFNTKRQVNAEEFGKKEKLERAIVISEKQEEPPTSEQVAIDSKTSKDQEVEKAQEEVLKDLSKEEFIRAMGLLNIKEEIPEIAVDLRYASANNFLGKVLYNDMKNCYLQPEVVQMLAVAQKNLKKLQPEYTLLVFDGCRPLSVQKEMYEKVKGTNKQRYVASPYGGGGMHNYGAAVDLSIRDEFGKEIDMGTPFDYFGELAQPRHESRFFQEGKLSREQWDNRQLLRKVMRDAGFRMIQSEWWHFNAFNKEEIRTRYGIID